jgi:hypothetical protein
MSDQPTIAIAPVVLSMAASAVGALAAGVLGVRIGLKKVKLERAFEKQLTWYQELAETIQLVRNRYKGFQLFVSDPKMHANVPQALEDLAKNAFRFQELAVHANLYATRETFDRVTETLGAMNALSPEFLAPKTGSDERGRAGSDASMRMLDILYMCLARDLRRLLGLEPLAPHDGLVRALEQERQGRSGRTP